MDVQARQYFPKHTRTITLVVFIVFISLIGFALCNRSHTAAKARAKLDGYCVGTNLVANSSGHCVSDVQTMINFMEHSGLTQCPFENSAPLSVNGIYGGATVAQVTSIQHWATCYAKQEGFTSNVQETGTVNRATWGELCTYGYTDPIRSSVTGANDSIAAGSDAGCAQMRS